MEQLKAWSELILAVSGAAAVLWKGRTLLRWLRDCWYKLTTPKAMRQQIELLTAQQKASMEVMQGLTNMVQEVRSSVAEVVKELKPNGGSSLRDAVNLIVAKQRARDNTTEQYGVFETDKNGGCTHCNLQYLRMTGRTQEEVIGNGWVNCIYPEDRAYVREQWAEAVQDNRDFEMQYRMVNADGEPFEVIGRAVVMKDQLGRAIGYYGTIQKLDNTH